MTPDYLDDGQVVEAGELIRGAGLQAHLSLYYKPDIFSALKINSKNNWGFKVTTETYNPENRRVRDFDFEPWKRRKTAEEWFAEAQEANGAESIVFAIREEEELSQQRELLSYWLDDNEPSMVRRSSSLFAKILFLGRCLGWNWMDCD